MWLPCCSTVLVALLLNTLTSWRFCLSICINYQQQMFVRVRVAHLVSFLCCGFCCCYCFVCLRRVSCVPNVASVSGLSSSRVLCSQCCQCLWLVLPACLVYPMLPVSLDCLRRVSCVPNVASVPGLSSPRVLCTQCCQCLWIVFVACLV